MEALQSLEEALDSLEEVLEPLMAEKLPETLSKLDLLQQAKLQVLLPYVFNDLIFIYLKTRGINPKTHPVFAELDRVKQYFEKIKKAEDPDKRKLAVDQAAATRFIKHAMKESQAAQRPSQPKATQGSHTRFNDSAVEGTSASAAALAKIHARNADNEGAESSSEESDLEVFVAPEDEQENVASLEEKGEDGEAEEEAEAEAEAEAARTNSKRRRTMDPWAGYDEPAASKSSGKA